MNRTQQIFQALQAEHNNNPSKDAPYHNSVHMARVWEIAKWLWISESNKSGVPLDAEWANIALMIAAMLHDWGHSAGKEIDEVNVHVARIKAKLFIDECIIEIPAEVAAVVDSAIRCTQFPFVIPPKNNLERVLRDADLLYTAIDGNPALVMEDLRSEMEVVYGKSITYREMLIGQDAFLKKAEVFTGAGRLAWDRHADKYFEKLEGYVAVKDLARLSVVDTCEFGHNYTKLPGHPMHDGSPRCPNCMSIGLDRARSEKEKQLEAILSFIDEGCDELLIRRIWERAMIAGHKS